MLSNLLLFPIFGVLALLIIPKLETTNITNSVIKFIGIISSSSTFVYSLNIWSQYDMNKFGFQLCEELTWFSFPIYIAIDGISLIFIFLTTFILFLSVISIANNDNLGQHRFYKSYFICLLLIEFFLLTAFVAADILFFYIFFESILIPMFFIIGIWGSGYRKIKAGYYFFLYTLVGSLFMLIGIAMLFYLVGTTNIFVLMKFQFSYAQELIIWLCFFLSFSVKIPMFPFHIWLPEAHVEAPTEGSVILAALLLKLGGYGFIRFSLTLLPNASSYFSPLIFTLALLGISYSSLTALRQVDMKRIIAYASIAHMNFVVLGIFSMNEEALSGAIFLMFAHGLVSSALFFLVGVLYKKYGTRLIYYYGGLAQVMPIFTLLFLFFSFANAGLPGTSNFVGEILIFLGLGEVSLFLIMFSSLGFILSIVYSIWLCNRVCFGNLRTCYINFFSDIDLSDLYVLAPLAFLTVIFGVYPVPILELIFLDVNHIVVNQELSLFR